MIRRALRLFWRAALAVFFRRVEVIGLERVPRRGPLLVVANHTNAFVDALLLLAWLPRPLTLTAKDTLRRDPLLDLLFFRGHDVIALSRAQDAGPGADPARNAAALDACAARLREGGAVLLFPEGVSHQDPDLRPFRTGAARLASDVGDLPLTVLPIGLRYADKARFRSRVVVEVGEPCDARAWLEREPTVAGRTKDLERRVRDVVPARAHPALREPPRAGSTLDALRSVEGLVLGAPGAALGLALHGPPCALVRAIARRRSTDEDHWATNTLVPSIVVFPLWYALLLALALVTLPAWGVPLAGLVTAWSGLLALAYVDHVRALRPRDHAPLVGAEGPSP